MAISGLSSLSAGAQSLEQLDGQANLSASDLGKSGEHSGKSGGFSDLLQKGIQEVNLSAKAAEKSSVDMASGKSTNIHETMLAVTKAELGFHMMVQLRNKVVEAYQDVMRMQV